jgi:uncharacterized alpha-E superfamily protein
LPAQVADFLMLDRHFPRAMHFCLIKAEESLLAINGGQTGGSRSPAEQHLGRLRAELDFAYIGEIIEHGLHEFIDRFQSKLNWVGEAISETYFGVRPTSSWPEDRATPAGHTSRQRQTPAGQSQTLATPTPAG